jgi:hypothetical protein
MARTREFHGIHILPYLQGEGIEYDTDRVTSICSSAKEVEKWLKAHPDLYKTVPLISEYIREEDGKLTGVADWYRNGSLVPLEDTCPSMEPVWTKTAHRMCSVHPSILRGHEVEDSTEFYQQVMPKALQEKQKAYCNGCGTRHKDELPIVHALEACDCGSHYLTYADMLEQVNWF